MTWALPMVRLFCSLQGLDNHLLSCLPPYFYVKFFAILLPENVVRNTITWVHDVYQPHLRSCSICDVSSDLIFDFMVMLSKRLTEIDVSTILTILQCKPLWMIGTSISWFLNFAISKSPRSGNHVWQCRLWDESKRWGPCCYEKFCAECSE